MTTITEFIAARLDEDEAAAGQSRTWRIGHHECTDYDCDQLCPDAAECAADRCWHKTVKGSDGMLIYDEGGHDAADAEHIARHDPARVLREVAAMRAILREHQAVARLASLTGQELGFLGWYREWILRNLAAIWSDHPDFPPEWAPEAAEAR